MHSARRLPALMVLMPFVLTVGAGVAAAQPLPPFPHRPVETPTVVTFYENEDLSGASYSVEAKPISSLEATRSVSTNEITTAGLYGRISSVQIACGTRPSRASLFDIDWSPSSDGTVIECAPNTTVSINLATQTGPATLEGRRDLNNRLGAAAIVAHVRSSDNGVHLRDFSSAFGLVWKSRMQSLDGASPQWTNIWLAPDFHTVHVEQALTLHHLPCTNRGSVFELRITMTTANFRPVFHVDIVSEWVAYGFGDAWPLYCHKNMLSSLDSSLQNAKSEIETQLGQLFESTSSDTYYFASGASTRLIDAFFSQ
jgi:hypothetical protein